MLIFVPANRIGFYVMKQLDRQSVLRTFKEYFLISVGLLMYAFAWICILMPAEVMGGGVNGVGLLIYYGT